MLEQSRRVTAFLAALLWATALALLISARAVAAAPEVPGIATPADGQAYLVTEFLPRYVADHPQHPPLSTVLEAGVELGEVSDGYVAPRAGVPTRRIRLNQDGARVPARYYASALAAINRTILGELNRLGLAGVRVQTSPGDIDPASGDDRRKPEQRTLGVDIETGRISGLRVIGVETFALGDRFPPKQAADNPVHRRIKERSPIQPADSARTGATDLLRIDLLEDYVARLNRHPGRRVVAEISPSRMTPGSAYLDYKIVEAKPWTVYSQFDRTGTEETHRWRQRFGFRHTQLRGEDDTLRLDYVTGGEFGDVHGIFFAYESPLASFDHLRWQVNALYSEYDASEFGINNVTFEGREHGFGLQLIANVFQRRKLFVDLIGEIRWQDIEVKDGFFNIRGDEDLFIPRVRLRAETMTDAVQFHADVGWERSLGGGSSLEKLDLQRLGRIDPDERWQILRWDAALSFFVEPVLARALPGKIDAQGRIHEIRLSSRGQEAFDNRLIPQHEMVVGGLYTVRGYPQAELAGDSVTAGTVEYRLHLTRLLATPGVVSGLDWDLTLSAFADLARVRHSQKLPGELDTTLFGAGLGLELRILRNVRVRYNFGMALRDVEDLTGAKERVERGDVEHHLALTLFY
ncbi:MAG: ShlB/FhaC/HecB family hemolysin secretion/activation protein [Myxococcota bacterium]